MFSETKDNNIPLVLLLTFSSCLNGIPHACWSFYWFSTDQTNFFKVYFFFLFPWPWVLEYYGDSRRLELAGHFFQETPHYNGLWTASLFLTAASLCVRCLLPALPPPLTSSAKQVSQPLRLVCYTTAVFSLLNWTCCRYEAEKEDGMYPGDFLQSFTARENINNHSSFLFTQNRCLLVESVSSLRFHILWMQNAL